MSQQSVQLNIQNGIAIISLNRPDKLNCLNEELCSELFLALDAIQNSGGIRAVIIRGEGRAFSAGQDLNDISETAFSATNVGSIVRDRYNRLVRSIRDSPIPFVASIGGVAAGAGASLAMCADIIIAADDSRFSLAFVHIGLIPDTAATYLLPRAVGFARARAICLLGDSISAAEALQAGLVYKVVPASLLEEETLRVAERLRALPKEALSGIKRAFEQSQDNAREEQLELEAELQMALAATADFREGVQAFREKRSPRFTGA